MKVLRHRILLLGTLVFGICFFAFCVEASRYQAVGSTSPKLMLSLVQVNRIPFDQGKTLSLETLTHTDLMFVQTDENHTRNILFEMRGESAKRLSYAFVTMLEELDTGQRYYVLHCIDKNETEYRTILIRRSKIRGDRFYSFVDSQDLQKTSDVKTAMHIVKGHLILELQTNGDTELYQVSEDSLIDAFWTNRIEQVEEDEPTKSHVGKWYEWQTDASQMPALQFWQYGQSTAVSVYNITSLDAYDFSRLVPSQDVIKTARAIITNQRGLIEYDIDIEWKSTAETLDFLQRKYGTPQIYDGKGYRSYRWYQSDHSIFFIISDSGESMMQVFTE